MERLKSKSFEDLVVMEKEAAERTNKPMLLGIANYDILSDPTYQDYYAYIPCSHPKRAQYAISEYKDKQARKLSFDLVRLVIDLPYLPLDRATDLDFSTEYLYSELK